MKNSIVLIFFMMAAAQLQAANPDDIKFNLGIHLGVNLGAAVPWPLSKGLGDDDMKVSLKTIPEFGFSTSYHLSSRWTTVAEASCSTFGINAGLFTRSGQKFKDDGTIVVFYGRASTEMLFSVLDFPLYCKFKISENHRVYLGMYYSHLLKGKFNATALTGYMINPADPNDLQAVVEPLYQNFTPNLRRHDFGWLFGYEYQIIDRLSITGRFSIGLRDIFKNGENYLDYKMLQMRGLLMFSYRIL